MGNSRPHFARKEDKQYFTLWLTNGLDNGGGANEWCAGGREWTGAKLE